MLQRPSKYEAGPQKCCHSLQIEGKGGATWGPNPWVGGGVERRRTGPYIYILIIIYIYIYMNILMYIYIYICILYININVYIIYIFFKCVYIYILDSRPSVCTHKNCVYPIILVLLQSFWGYREGLGIYVYIYI